MKRPSMRAVEIRLGSILVIVEPDAVQYLAVSGLAVAIVAFTGILAFALG